MIIIYYQYFFYFSNINIITLLWHETLNVKLLRDHKILDVMDQTYILNI